VAALGDEIAALRARQDAVESLQTDRNLPVHLMNESVKELPDGVYLSSVKQEGSNVLIQGVAQSNERVSELLRNLTHGSDWLSHPELVEIVSSSVALGANEKRRVYNFTVRYQLRRPEAAGKPGMAAAAPAAHKAH
jgi:type IV pilus assembly protein PilN